jgi:hypothetical protein
MKKFLFLCCALVSAAGLYAQQPGYFYCTGSVKDKTTGQPLKDVRIFYRDTIPATYSDSKGAFRMEVKTGDRLQFRKRGYGWHTVRITGKEKPDVSLTRSKPDAIKPDSSLIYDPEHIPFLPGFLDIICDGQLVPHEEWADVFSMDKDEITSVSVTRGEVKKENNQPVVVRKHKIVLKTTFLSIK